MLTHKPRPANMKEIDAIEKPEAIKTPDENEASNQDKENNNK